MYEDEDNDCRFPDESPIEVRYPRSKQEKQSDREQWPWLPGTIVEQCGPDEWYVCVEVRELAVLRDGRRAPHGTASRNLYYPCCFRAARRSGRAPHPVVPPRRRGPGRAGTGTGPVGRPRIPSARWLRTFGSFPRRPGGANHDGMTAIETSYESLLKVRKGAVGIVDVPEFGFVAVTGTSQHAVGPGAGEQPGPVPAAAADGNGSQPPGQGRAGAALLAASVAGVALAPLALRRLGRGGSLLVAAGCGALFARDVQMTLTGAPARLRPLPRLLLRTEVPVSGSAAGAALLACWQQRPGVARVAAAAAAATFAVHAVREAIYLSPGHGSEEPAAQ